MNKPTKKLRLGPLPKTESTKLSFVCSVGLKAELDRYAALHAQAYGEMVDEATLIPHMLRRSWRAIGDFRLGQQGLRFRPLRWKHRHARLDIGVGSADFQRHSGFSYLWSCPLKPGPKTSQLHQSAAFKNREISQGIEKLCIHRR